MKRLTLYYTDWCGGCRKVKHILKELKQKYSDITFDYVNMDTSNVLYPISIVPTVVLEHDGIVKATITGTQSKYDYEHELKRL